MTENRDGSEEIKAPLLGEKEPFGMQLWSSGILRSDFVSRLPEKVRSGIDPEKPFFIDVSRSSDLNEGNFYFLPIFFFEDVI